jgi:hypothetical protein
LGKWLEKKRKPPKAFIANATLTPTSLHLYNVPENGYNRTEAFERNKANLLENHHKGELSRKAARRIKTAIEWLLIRSTPKHVWNRHQEKSYFFRLNFITLTLPSKQIHSDKEIISRCLNNFLNIMRNKHGITDYIWRAEAQYNGNIHFHITGNKFVHWRYIRAAWCSSVNLLGYVDRFAQKFHHMNPPCTEVRKVKHIRRIAAYLSSYLAKNKQFAPVGEIRMIAGKRIEVLYSDKVYRDEDPGKKQGKVIATMLSERLRHLDCNLWGCSQSISKVRPLRFDASSIQWQSIRNISFSPLVKCVKGDYVDSFYGQLLQVAAKVSPGLYHDMISHANGRTVNQVTSDEKILQYLE